MVRRVSVAEAKSRFSELLARTAYAGERFVIARRGKPLAGLVALGDLERLEGDSRAVHQAGPQGLLAAARALADYEGFERVMAEALRARRRSAGRPVSLR